MIKIGVICDFNKSGGGANQYQLRLLNRLVKSNLFLDKYEFIVINGSDEISINLTSNVKTIKIKNTFVDLCHYKILSNLFMKKVLSYFWLDKSRLEKKLYKLQIDYAFFLTPDYRSLSFSYIPIILTVWDIGHRKLQDLDEYKYKLNFEFLENFYRTILPKSVGIFVDSKTTALEVQNCYSILPNKIAVLGMDWAISDKKLESQIDFGLSNHFKYIYYPANYWSHKNHFFLLKVLQEIVKLRSDIKLILTGRDQNRNKAKIFNFVKEMGLLDFVIDFNYLEEIEQYALFKHVDCLVFPTKLGPTNIPPYEATLFGVPSVISNVHEINSYKIQGINIMENFEVKLWVEKIISLIDNPVIIDSNFIENVHDPIIKIKSFFDEIINKNNI